MALSNKFGHLVLTTGNRSELAVGYCTLYGDMAGGFAVLKDVPKTLVYELAAYRNQVSHVIPERTITRPPTAELAFEQKDEDTLPPYAVLDKILECYLNHSQSIDEITAQGFERDMVIRVINMIYKSEYKRKQAAIGPHINHKSFGKDWRYPITNGFKK
jgi:NAD+ synthase (glutamine-hydrolysing)